MLSGDGYVVDVVDLPGGISHHPFGLFLVEEGDESASWMEGASPLGSVWGEVADGEANVPRWVGDDAVELAGEGSGVAGAPLDGCVVGGVRAGDLDRRLVDPQIGRLRLDGVGLEEEGSCAAEGVEDSIAVADAGKSCDGGGDGWVQAAGHRVPAVFTSMERYVERTEADPHRLAVEDDPPVDPIGRRSCAVPAGVIPRADELLDSFTDEVLDVEPVVVAGSLERRAHREAASRAHTQVKAVDGSRQRRPGASWVGNGGLDDEEVVGQSGWIGDDRR